MYYRPQLNLFIYDKIHAPIGKYRNSKQHKHHENKFTDTHLFPHLLLHSLFMSVISFVIVSRRGMVDGIHAFQPGAGMAARVRFREDILMNILKSAVYPLYSVLCSLWWMSRYSSDHGIKGTRHCAPV